MMTTMVKCYIVYNTPILNQHLLITLTIDIVDPKTPADEKLPLEVLSKFNGKTREVTTTVNSIDFGGNHLFVRI